MIASVCTSVPQLPDFLQDRLNRQRAPFQIDIEFPLIDLAVFAKVQNATSMKEHFFIQPTYSHEYGRDYAKNIDHPPVRKTNRDLFPEPDCEAGRYLGRHRLPDKLPWHGALCYENVSYLIERAGLEKLSKRFRRKGDVVDSD